MEWLMWEKHMPQTTHLGMGDATFRNYCFTHISGNP